MGLLFFLLLGAKVYGTFPVAQGVAADRVSFGSAYEMRVPAIVYHQAGATIVKHPAIVFVNGDKSQSNAVWMGVVYARAGAVVLTFDSLGQFERDWEKRSDRGPAKDVRGRLADFAETDIQQAVRYLEARVDVDPKRIAVVKDSADITGKETALSLFDRLKLPNWTKKQLGKMELGADVPTVPRENLKAIPDVIWQAEEDNYVWEGFRNKVNALPDQP